MSVVQRAIGDGAPNVGTPQGGRSFIPRLGSGLELKLGALAKLYNRGRYLVQFSGLLGFGGFRVIQVTGLASLRYHAH
jgi:hypothetical protein